MGLKILRQLMSNWLLRAAEDWLSPSYDTLHKQLYRQTVLNGNDHLASTERGGGNRCEQVYICLYRTS